MGKLLYIEHIVVDEEKVEDFTNGLVELTRSVNATLLGGIVQTFNEKELDAPYL